MNIPRSLQERQIRLSLKATWNLAVRIRRRSEPMKFYCSRGTRFSGRFGRGTFRRAQKSGARRSSIIPRSSPKIFEHQKRIVDKLKLRFPGRVTHFPVQITKHGMKSLEHTRRSRSFLYATVAFIVAYILGNIRIRFFENGVVSINLPIADQVVGSRATRTTHPLVLAQFCAFSSAQ